MKTIFSFLFVSSCLILSSCERPNNVVEKDPDLVFSKAAHFNQVNTAFRGSHADCLLSQWYSGKYQSGPPIVLLVINDPAAYAALFSCSLSTQLPSINFATSSLLVGMKADYGRFVNSPVNITRIEQNLIQSSSDTFVLQVKVTGKQSPNGVGGEWFAFTSVVPKLTSTVNLDMQYQFK
jgi:hypothetical protein